MRHILTTTALLAALCAFTPLGAQERPLERMIEDALEGLGPEAGPAARPAPSDFGFSETAPELFSEDELDELLAPVALYPDALLAQVLVAATFPLQIVKADRLLEARINQSDEELTAAIDGYDWDPSVLVLMTGFPDVIRRMAVDLDDTERLGVAMAQQDVDVLDAVQRLRLQAEDTGYLASNEAQVVEREENRIVIEPADPEIVYVPRYDPALAFTSAPTVAPVIQRPGSAFGLDNPLIAGGIGFGSALLVNELFGDDDEDDDSDGWDDYWRRDRQAIDWRDRQVYPRAYAWDDDARRREAAWSRERDLNWDRDAQRWRPEADDARRAAWRDRREGRAWEVRRDPDTGVARVRLQDWNDALAAVERRTEAEADRDRRRAQARTAARHEEAEDEARRDARRREAAERERNARRNEAREEKENRAQNREENRAERRAEEAAEREDRERKAAADARRERRAVEPDDGDRANERAAEERRRDERQAAERARAAAKDERKAEQAAEARREHHRARTA